MTLLEVTLYIGLLAIVLPASVIFLLRVREAQENYDARLRMEQTAAIVRSELNTQIAAADSISVSTSTLNAAQSVLRFTDDSGTTIIIDAPTTTYAFPGGNQSVKRLRMQIGANPAFYLTDPEIDVTEWRVQVVRNSDNDLTGLRISLDMAMLNAGTDAYRQAEFEGDTTIALSPHTIEN